MPGYANLELVEQLSPWFVRNDRAATAWGNALSLGAQMPGVRGFWPMSGQDSFGNARDHGGGVRTLDYNGSIVYSLAGLAPFATFDGVGDFFDRADEAALSITGTETVIAAAYRGLTIMCWALVDSLAPGHDYGLVTKWNTAGGVDERAYMLSWDDATNCPEFAISSDGTAAAVDTVTSGTALAVSTWYHLAGRFDPSTEIAVFVNGVKTVNVAGIPAAIDDGSASLIVGGYDEGATGLLHGSLSQVIISAMNLPDYFITAHYEQTRALFGV